MVAYDLISMDSSSYIILTKIRVLVVFTFKTAFPYTSLACNVKLELTPTVDTSKPNSLLWPVNIPLKVDLLAQTPIEDTKRLSLQTASSET